MADECKCVMIEVINRMKEDIQDGKNSDKEIAKVISEIKETHTETKFLMERIKITQDSMALADKESKAALMITNKETKDLFVAGFKEIADKRLADKNKIIEEKKAIALKRESDEEKAKEIKRIADIASLAEKKKNRWAIYMVVIVLVINTLYGLLKVYVPKLVGL